MPPSGRHGTSAGVEGASVLMSILKHGQIAPSGSGSTRGARHWPALCSCPRRPPVLGHRREEKEVGFRCELNQGAEDVFIGQDGRRAIDVAGRVCCLLAPSAHTTKKTAQLIASGHGRGPLIQEEHASLMCAHFDCFAFCKIRRLVGGTLSAFATRCPTPQNIGPSHADNPNKSS